MAGFLYYVPGSRPAAREHLVEIGFPHAHEAGAWSESPGPDGQRGYVFALKATGVAGARQPEPAFDPKSVDPNNPEPRQVWHECEDGRWWLGWNLEDKPRPVDLLRREVVTGVDTRLSDDRVWRVPQVRGPGGRPQVPCVLDITPHGRITECAPAPQYRRLWSALGQAIEKIVEGVNVFSDEDTIHLVCDVMGWNYRVTIWELLKLGCLTTENFAPLFVTIAGLGNEEETTEARRHEGDEGRD